MDIIINYLKIYDLFGNNLHNFVNSVKKKIPIEHNSSKSRIYKCKVDQILFIAKIYFYEIETIKDNYMYDIEAETLILHKFKETIIQRNYSNNIIELYDVYTTNDVRKIAKAYDDNTANPFILDMKEYIKQENNADKMTMLLMPTGSNTLEEFISDSIDSDYDVAALKAIIFQIIYTQFIIHHFYPDYRHYDLHTENILVMLKNNKSSLITNPRFFQYKINEVIFNVQRLYVTPKIIDFGFSKIPSEGIVSSKLLRVENTKQREYDVANLLKFIYVQLLNKTPEHTKSLKLIAELINPKLFLSGNIPYNSTNLPTYTDYFNSPAFDEYKVKKNVKIYHKYKAVKDKTVIIN